MIRKNFIKIIFKNILNKRILKNLILVILTLFILSSLLSKKILAEEFKRVKRETYPYSITFSFSISCLSSSSSVSYNINPSIYATISPIKNIDLFFQIPLHYSYNKTYNVDLIKEEVSKEESYLLSLTNITAGFQWTFYTRFINDIFFYISCPAGIYPAFYKRSSIDVDLIEPEISVSCGYRLSLIADPLLFSITPKFTGYYIFPELIKSKDKWSQQYSISTKINLTVVLNSIISTSFSLTSSFIFPKIKEFEGWGEYELYKMKFRAELGLGIRISEDISIGLSMDTNLEGYLIPEYNINVTIKG